MIAYMLIIAGFLLRLVPHVPNMAPVAAIALFAGAHLNKKLVPWVPLAIMVLSDLVLGLHDVVLYTWGAFMVIGYAGMWLKDRQTPGSILASTVVSAVFFFAVTNFGVWMVWYPRTWAGFTECYIKALPFLRNTLIGNVVFAFLLFGAYELARRIVEKRKYSSILLAE